MLAEWHLDPMHIMDTWTEELLHLMVTKMVERKQGETSPNAGVKDYTGANAAHLSGVKYEQR